MDFYIRLLNVVLFYGIGIIYITEFIIARFDPMIVEPSFFINVSFSSLGLFTAVYIPIALVWLVRKKHHYPNEIEYFHVCIMKNIEDEIEIDEMEPE